MNSLEEVENEIQSCKQCNDLIKLKCNSISNCGNNKILFIGESPAKNGWILSGRAFYDLNNKLLPTGKVLEKLLNIINLNIDEITFTEACKCHIPDRKLLKECSKKCLIYLEKQIVLLDSKIVIPLGEHPTKILIGDFNRYGAVVGKVFHKDILGKDVIIIPIYHPSPVNPKGYKENVEIFEKIKEVING